MPVFIERPQMAVPVEVTRRSTLVQSLLLGIGIAYVNVAILILVLSEPPQFKHFLWAAGLGIACALLTYQRTPQAAKPPGTAAQS
jgi:hypothetical protein